MLRFLTWTSQNQTRWTCKTCGVFLFWFV